MISNMPYSLAFVCIFLTASLSVLGQGEETDTICVSKITCQDCVSTVVHQEVGNNGTCVYELSRTGLRCVRGVNITEGVMAVAYSLDGCAHIHTGNTTTPAPGPPTPPTTAPPPTPVTPNTTTTTTAPPTTTTPAANSTTTTPPSTTTAPTNGTTVPTTTAAPTNGTTTTPAPTNVTTTAAPPTPKPAPGGFAWGEFFGGIVFAIALSSLAYLIWRFYKVRMDRNYHTFSNPTF